MQLELPTSNVQVVPAIVTVKLDYGLKAESNESRNPDQDVIAIARALCSYSRGYSLTVVYTDGWYIRVDWHLVRSLCDGYAIGLNTVISEENLIEHAGGYQSAVDAIYNP
jgi:hypothetical protein